MEVRLDKILVYMLGNSHKKTSYGLITTGKKITFIKLVKAENHKYGI